MYARVFVYYTQAPIRSHVPTFQPCVYIHDGIECSVCKFLPTHIYCESERKYMSVVCVLGVVHSVTVYAGLFG